MSTATAEPTEDGTAADGTAADDTAEDGAESLAELETRGTLQIDHLVVRKIAEHTADADRRTTTVARTLGADRGASVRVGGSGNQVDLTLDIGLDYPVDLRAAVRRVRTRVTEEVHRLTGYRVRSIDVTVSALRSDSTTSRVR